ncbi:hypothetical protein [Capnocytophaga sp. G2]|uniref:hypothetical protein n=1 Tax=Capnocytophaga sp. G2 TaxID=3110695 RepID=UPI002B49BD46|nr:hypothetical protein [Capnocytophaga sp. G2]MEB3005986.1 hypothetical protein [Capnocytophaga sp. G2]
MDTSYFNKMTKIILFATSFLYLLLSCNNPTGKLLYVGLSELSRHINFVGYNKKEIEEIKLYIKKTNDVKESIDFSFKLIDTIPLSRYKFETIISKYNDISPNDTIFIHIENKTHTITSVKNEWRRIGTDLLGFPEYRPVFSFIFDGDKPSGHSIYFKRGEKPFRD